MGRVYYGIHQVMALKARDKFGLEALVETGTYSGETAFWASDKFERVVTIELSDIYYQVAAKKLEGTHNVLLIKGDSREWLGAVCVGRTHHPTLFWLDAHDSGEPETYDPNGPSVLDEIRIINESFFGPHVIMVDDYYALTNELKIEESIIREALINKKWHDRQVVVQEDVFFACQNLPQDFSTWIK